MASSPVTQSSGSLMVESPAVPPMTSSLLSTAWWFEGVFESLMAGPYPLAERSARPTPRPAVGPAGWAHARLRRAGSRGGVGRHHRVGLRVAGGPGHRGAPAVAVLEAACRPAGGGGVGAR